ncbi:hypothetical protein SDC9_178226 [bioreactor metagenome]|uniref:Uncharacterized protein n=1 Tax=bioreactor metagenome TaxID=1076179 RepID=A0A645GVD6_9ZZZZ
MDVGEHPEFAGGYPVSVIPTQLLFDSKGNPYMPEDPTSSGMDLYSLKSTGEHALTAHTGTISKEQLLNILKDMGME